MGGKKIVLVTEDDSVSSWCRFELGSAFRVVSVPPEKFGHADDGAGEKMVLADCMENRLLSKKVLNHTKRINTLQTFILITKSGGLKNLKLLKKDRKKIFPLNFEESHGCLKQILDDVLAFVNVRDIADGVQNGISCLKKKLQICHELPGCTGDVLFHSGRMTKKRCNEIESFDIMSGTSEVMKSFRKKVQEACASQECVLVTGESGCGKSYTVDYIQRNCCRKTGPYVKVNVSHFSQDNLESELFGTVSGAFTGSMNRQGLLCQCSGGVFVFDEIGEVNSDIQKKLLDLIEEKKFRRLGSSTELEVDVRFMFSTNASLEQLMDEGKFRRDLFYRINVLNIHVPSLREHIEDVPLLAERFLLRKKKVMTLKAAEKLCTWDYPGNIRELNNILLRACAASDLVKNSKVITDEMIQFV